MTPKLTALSLPSYDTNINVAVNGIIRAAPIPSIIDQPTSSISTFRHKAAIIVPTPYIAVPIINVLFMPIISPSLPPVSVKAAITSEYNAIANWILSMFVFRSCTKAVIATFIIVVSITIMNTARLINIITPHLLEKSTVPRRKTRNKYILQNLGQ